MYKYELSVKYNDETEYQDELLKVFNVKEYNDDIIGKTRKLLYEDLIKKKEFNNLFDKACKILNNSYDDNEWGMLVLLSYDHFHKFHRCIQLFYQEKDDFIKEINLLNESL
tara:strand:+ start:5084 stop:5416 length:333 start_codon:yes stop_codon:yes gene_type:complete